MPEVIINGPEGRIEGRYHHARGTNAPMALVLHPHPLHGGTMNNKIVYTLYQCFVKRGFSTLRFNFRGVGRSQGSFDRGEGELADAAAALDWLQGYNPNAPTCWVAGYSFGAWIGMQLLMRRPEIDAFISVSRPAAAARRTSGPWAGGAESRPNNRRDPDERQPAENNDHRVGGADQAIADFSNHIAYQKQHRRPDQGRDHISQPEAAAGHLHDAGGERNNGPDRPEKTADKHALPAMAFKEQDSPR